MGEINLMDQGTFLEEVFVGIADGNIVSSMAAESLSKLLAQTYLGKRDNDSIEITSEMRKLMKCINQPIEIMQEHSKEPVPTIPPSKWNK
eukprot:4327125-Ditylum_brightwellii.AAC.1